MPSSQDPVLLDESFFTDPYASYAALRSEGAVHRAVSADGAPLHLVTGYRQVRDAATHPALSLNKRHARTEGRDGASMPPELNDHLLNSDPADHARLRRAVNGAFTARRTELLRDDVQEITDRLLHRMASRPRADVVADFAMPLSMEVICRVLGIPPENRPDFRAWTNTLLSPDPRAAQQSREAMRHMHRFLVTLIDRKREHPADDLLSGLVLAQENDDRLSPGELVAMAFLLLFGGYHNTGSLIATSVMALLIHPAHRAAFASGELSPHAVTEEALRWNSPTMLAVRRFATQDVRIAGTDMLTGDRVWLSWASANRDPERFEEPEVFDPYRKDNAHLAFGHGSHHCPGAALARLENAIAVTSLMRRFPEVSLIGSPDELRWFVSPRIRSLSELPVTL
ncbi:cytochrome P450 [Streptomyces sp. NPDC021098]|uniref:cytochrome P450 family protein n=1 Tax=unclassified Streptomyces TaxID=2593676 RepID=UPI0037BA20E0